MKELESEFLTEMIGHIYEAAVDPEHWQELVSMLERAYPHSRVTLFGHDVGQPLQSLKVSKNFNADDLKAYAEHHVRTSPLVPRGYNLPVGVATRSEEMISEAELKRSEHYNDTSSRAVSDTSEPAWWLTAAPIEWSRCRWRITRTMRTVAKANCGSCRNWDRT
jgi:hypothetical protein